MSIRSKWSIGKVNKYKEAFIGRLQAFSLANKFMKLGRSINGKIYGLNPRLRCHKIYF